MSNSRLDENMDKDKEKNQNGDEDRTKRGVGMELVTSIEMEIKTGLGWS